jgi:membrane protease subunit (stomatin/prohibitin family)
MARVFDVVEYPNDMKYEVVHKFPEVGTGDYRMGTTVIVRPGQNAVFHDGGQILHIFPQGQHTITAKEIPVLENSLGDNIGAQKTFSVDVYFVRTSIFHDTKWGLPNPTLVGNTKIGRAYIQAYGKYSYYISDLKVFFNEYFDYSNLRLDGLEEHIRDILVAKIPQAIEYISSIFEDDLLNILNNHKKEISERMLFTAKEECASFGITLKAVSFIGSKLADDSAKLLQNWRELQMPMPLINNEEVDPNLVFVIIAFHDDMEPIFTSIKSAAEAVGLVARRVKDVPGDYRITDQIIKMIRSARFVVADLTHERPNVYFELGYARGVGKKVVTLAREGTNVHFDVKDWTYISYTDSRPPQRDLEERFQFEISED